MGKAAKVIRHLLTVVFTHIPSLDTCVGVVSIIKSINNSRGAKSLSGSHHNNNERPFSFEVTKSLHKFDKCCLLLEGTIFQKKKKKKEKSFTKEKKKKTFLSNGRPLEL